jgi:hypothetical protein
MTLNYWTACVERAVFDLRIRSHAGPAYSRASYMGLKLAIEDLQKLQAKWEAEVAENEAALKRVG